MQRLEWFFDFVSPFSYLQTARFGELPDDVELELRPVLLAALLGHWEMRGPAEVPAKRRFTYRYVQWYAQRHGVPFRMPPAHPFNPLPLLRLALALRCRREVVLEIFGFVWAEGNLPDRPAAWRSLTARLGVDDAEARIAAPEVKAELRRNTEQALARGVFGVPTFALGEELFWGADATDMLLDYLRDPGLLESEEMRRVSELPVGVERRPR